MPVFAVAGLILLAALAVRLRIGSVVAIAMNLISRSKFERALMTPVSLAIGVAFLVVTLTA
ncbi:hypothetical protein [Glycomyces salinus]|uniref:hypothetical protein n=1 Tax=Glycomyces salinus TaxID=980294 RepID=UPI0018EDB43B|nr:hypothetical protein [Glycomyces salinus]